MRCLAEWLQYTRTPWAVIGGIAASTLGRPRFTRDIGAQRDLEDIEGLVAANPAIDAARILGRVDQFAKALAMPGLLTDLERILSRAHSTNS